MSQAVTAVPLGSVTTWLSGGTPDRSNEKYWTGPIPWISAATLKKSRIWDSDQRVTASAVRVGSKLAPQGSTLILVRGMALHNEVRAGLAMRPMSFNQDVKALVPRPGLLPEFLTYSLHARRSDILDLVSSAGSGTGVLDTALLKRLPIWVPDPHEQRSIVNAIDDVESTVENLERLITKKQAIKQGMMQQLLTGKTRFPGFTDKWVKGPLKMFMPLQRGFDLPATHVRPGPFPVVYSNGISRTHCVAMVKGPGVITGRSGTIGKVHFVESDYWPHNTSLWVTSFARADPKFTYYYLSNLGLERFASGSGVPTFNRNDAHRHEVCLPPERKEQQAIASVLTDLDTELNFLVARLTKAQAIKQGMMQELLTGRTRLPASEAAS